MSGRRACLAWGARAVSGGSARALGVGLALVLGLAALDSSVPSPAVASEPNRAVASDARRASVPAIEQFRAFAADTRNARGEFTQQAIRSTGRPAPRVAGRFAFERPGRFRWQVSRPYEQIIVADGKNLYLYDVDLQQVSVRPMGEALGSTPAALLFGSGDLERDFVLTELGERDGLAWLEAQPRSREAGFDRIQLAFRQGLPVEMLVRDALGQLTQFVFAGIERNRPLDGELFSFTPPPGVDVIR